MFSFTIKSENPISEIITNAAISESLVQGGGIIQPEIIPVKVLWDTGCSNFCISSRLIRRLDLSPIGATIISDARGEIERNIYCIDFMLPKSTVILEDIMATEFDAPDNFDVIVGMQIISQGDFAISSENGQTMVSFSIPSKGFIDFCS